MAIPLLAPTFLRRLDPSDTLDLYPVLTQGDELKDILQPGEVVTSFSIVLPADTYAAGVRLVTEGRLAPRYDALVFAFVLFVDPAKRGLSIFDGTGFLAAIEINFATNFSDRDKQYTVLVRVVNK